MAYLTESFISLPGIAQGDGVVVTPNGPGGRPKLVSVGHLNGSLGRRPAYMLRWADHAIPQGERVLEILQLSAQPRRSSRRYGPRPVTVIVTMTAAGHRARLEEFLKQDPDPADQAGALLDYLGHALDGQSIPGQTAKRLTKVHKILQLALRTTFEGERSTGLAMANSILINIAFGENKGADDA